MLMTIIMLWVWAAGGLWIAGDYLHQNSNGTMLEATLIFATWPAIVTAALLFTAGCEIWERINKPKLK